MIASEAAADATSTPTTAEPATSASSAASTATSTTSASSTTSLSSSPTTSSTAPTSTVSPTGSVETSTTEISTAGTSTGEPETTSSSSTTSETVATESGSPGSGGVIRPGTHDERDLVIELSFSSRVADVGAEELRSFVLATLNDQRSWAAAGLTFIHSESSELQIVLAEPAETDQLCLPLRTVGRFSCQNGSMVVLNADRWRIATDTWDSTVADYRTYLVNHEVGHLVGQRHPAARCAVAGEPALVMAQQTKGLVGCLGNGWPLAEEIARASNRPIAIGD